MAIEEPSHLSSAVTVKPPYPNFLHKSPIENELTESIQIKFDFGTSNQYSGHLYPNKNGERKVNQLWIEEM